jgi:hypothetical protein
METKICKWCDQPATGFSPNTVAYACDEHRKYFGDGDQVWAEYDKSDQQISERTIDTNGTEMSTPFDDPRPRVYGELCILRRLHVLYRVTRSINIKPDEAAAAAIEIEALEIALMEFVS